jgi:redox-sensitive bicupin YhaK (pirin superfamily)
MSVEIETEIVARARDLGGFTVGRVLPAIGRRMVGPFTFLDHMGPASVEEMAVRPHPHINLATVTYLFEGEIVHRDTLGSHMPIKPGAINWMSAGKGIAHSERIANDGRVKQLHGLQLWCALPQAVEDSEPFFEHTPASALPSHTEAGATFRVLCGKAFGASSPVRTASPLFYVDVELEPGAKFGLPADYAERAAYVVSGAVDAGESRLEPRHMAVFSKGASPTLVADGPTRLVLLGGEPLDGPRYIWWNFVSSSRERIAAMAEVWRAGTWAKIPGDDVEFTPAPDGPRFEHQ